jgi:tRNA1(Val) A37 N6-methylase TrmN6
MWGMTDEDISQDYFYKRKVIVCQKKKGYRFSIDAPLLADFLPEFPNQEALEIGTGSGIISLLALYRKKFAKVYGIEIQNPLVRLAGMNAEKNGFSDHLTVIPGDFNEVYQDFSGIRHIFSNPPYFETNRGRLSPNPEIRDAKFETCLNLKQLISKSANIMGKGGNLYLVMPFSRFKQTITLIKKNHLYIKRSREVFSFKDGKPERFLVQLSNYNEPQTVMSPLIIFKEKGVYTEQMDSILSGETNRGK